jgi:AcrR family transcriptional regulator
MTKQNQVPAKPARWNNALAEAPDPREIRKRALIVAAGRVFGTKGFHNTTLDDIASALSVTKPALYRYVENKHQILFECHLMAVAMAEEALAQAMQDHAAPLQRLHAFAALYIRKITSELGTCVVLTEYYSMTPDHTEVIQRRRRVIDTALRTLVTQAMEQGLIAAGDAKLAVFFFMGAINNINRWFTEGGAQSGEQIAQAFADHTIACLSPLAVAQAGRPRRPAKT